MSYLSDIVKELLAHDAPWIVVVLVMVVILLAAISMYFLKLIKELHARDRSNSVTIHMGRDAMPPQETELPKAPPEDTALSARSRVIRGTVSNRPVSPFSDLEVMKKQGDEVQAFDLPPEK